MTREHLHFVTGRLAEHALRTIVEPLARQLDFNYTIDVMPITVAALLTTDWIAPRIDVPAGATRIVIPGYAAGELSRLEETVDIPVERGPRDLRQLPRYFSGQETPEEYGAYDIQIVAEINECPRRPRDEILREANALASAGADLIDVGCLPGAPWSGVGDLVTALRDAGHRTSIDSLCPVEIEAAVDAGAELVLSVNSSNVERAVDWGVEVIVTPDDPATLAGLDETVDTLAQAGVPLRIDPILEPIAFGLAASLGRYLETRRRYPDAAMLMGIGNLTELTDVDSAGINVLLLGFCQELGIHSVLTTQVINWARSSVAECDLARRLVRHAVVQQTLPKHLEPRLVMLRDAELLDGLPESFSQLADEIRDHNLRIFTADDEIHLIGKRLHLHDADPFVVMQQLLARELEKPLDASHAFYLGYEMCKARTALTLAKQYEQDEPLDWGMLTRDEARHYLEHPRQGEERR